MGCIHKDRRYNRSFWYAETIHNTYPQLMGSVAAMGGTYEFVNAASANLREKDDSWNPTLGGFFAGSVMGLRCASLLLSYTSVCQVN